MTQTVACLVSACELAWLLMHTLLVTKTVACPVSEKTVACLVSEGELAWLLLHTFW